MYTKPIGKMSDLGKDVQVFVEKGDELIAQCMCDDESCKNTPNTAGQLTEQSGYLVLTMQNISPSSRFDAFKWDKSGKTALLKNFTLDEVLRTSAAPDLTDGGLNPTVTQTEPLIMTNTAKVLIGVGALGALVALAALAVAFFRRRRCGPPPHQQHAR